MRGERLQLSDWKELRRRVGFRIRRYGGRALLWVGRLATAFILFSCLLVLAYRFVNPPTTPLIAYESFRLGAVDWRWAPIEEISADLTRSVVAAEDAGFCGHRGVEWAAVREALRDWRETGELRGASTITQQTAKNLFLWPGRSFV